MIFKLLYHNSHFLVLVCMLTIRKGRVANNFLYLLYYTHIHGPPRPNMAANHSPLAPSIMP